MDHTNVQHVVMASMGDLLGFWFGKWITFAVRHLAKMVPAYELPLTNGRKVVSFKKALAWASGAPSRPAPPRSIRLPFAIHRRHHGPVQGRGAHPPQHRGSHLAGRGVVHPALSKIGDVTKANSIAALPLYHIFALTLCLLAIRQGSSLTLIPNPRDIPKFVAELKNAPSTCCPP